MTVSLQERIKTSYIDDANSIQDITPDESAGSDEAGKTLGIEACGSDKSSDPLVHSSTPNGNLGHSHSVPEPAYEDGHDE